MSSSAAIREEALDRERGHGFGALAVGVLGTLWYALVADALLASHHLDALLVQVWQAADDPAALAGQWLTATLLALTRSLPEAGPHTLLLTTTLAGGITLGAFYWRLRRVGWSLAEALAATALLALHPATLMMATTGQTLLLTVLLVGVVVLALDRASTIGDAQSLMALGLALAALVLTAPNAVYIALPILALLPFCLHDVRDGGSAVALYLLTAFPSVIAVGGILLAAATLGEAPTYAMNRWLAPMHGLIDAANTPWLVQHGGSFFQPLWVLVALCALAMPPMVLPLISLLVRPDERQRPATALLALFGGPLAGAGATLFWHTEGGLPTIGVAMAAVVGWTSSRRLSPPERWLWLLWLAIGVVLSWVTAWLWHDPLYRLWREALGV